MKKDPNIKLSLSYQVLHAVAIVFKTLFKVIKHIVVAVLTAAAYLIVFTVKLIFVLLCTVLLLSSQKPDLLDETRRFIRF